MLTVIDLILSLDLKLFLCIKIVKKDFADLFSSSFSKLLIFFEQVFI